MYVKRQVLTRFPAGTQRLGISAWHRQMHLAAWEMFQGGWDSWDMHPR